MNMLWELVLPVQSIKNAQTQTSDRIKFWWALKSYCISEVAVSLMVSSKTSWMISVQRERLNWARKASCSCLLLVQTDIENKIQLSYSYWVLFMDKLNHCAALLRMSQTGWNALLTVYKCVCLNKNILKTSYFVSCLRAQGCFLLFLTKLSTVINRQHTVIISLCLTISRPTWLLQACVSLPQRAPVPTWSRWKTLPAASVPTPHSPVTPPAHCSHCRTTKVIGQQVKSS